MKRRNGSYYHLGAAWVTGTGGPCANSERGMSRLARRAIVGLVAAGVLLAASPASAAVHHSRPAASQPGLGDDVYFYRPILQSVLQKPPLETVTRFRTTVYTNFVPHAIHMVAHLYWWRSAAQLHRLKGAWVEIHPTVRYGLADIPAVGTHFELKPADWTCRPGRLYVRFHIYGITHTGRHESTNLYFPWAGFSVKHPNKGNVHKPPQLHRAWHTKCQGHDTLTG